MDGAKEPIHDTIEWYQDVVPFCRAGRQRWVEWTNPQNAEFNWCGQIRQEEPNPFPASSHPEIYKNPSKHIFELEGDFVAMPAGHPNAFREDFPGTIRIACGAPLSWRGQSVFARPTFSRFLVWAARHSQATFPEATVHQMAFRGLNDQHSVRLKMSRAMTGLPPAIVEFSSGWHGISPLNHPDRARFECNMLNCSMALCPQGNGVATARFYEACYYGRCPVIIGQTMLLGEDTFDVSFAPQINAWLPEDELRHEIGRIGEMTLFEARERGRMARSYFDRIVRPYFHDPTLCFLEWLEKKRLRT